MYRKFIKYMKSREKNTQKLHLTGNSAFQHGVLTAIINCLLILINAIPCRILLKKPNKFHLHATKNEILKSVKTINDVGVLFPSNLQFNLHTEKTVTSAMKISFAVYLFHSIEPITMLYNC